MKREVMIQRARIEHAETLTGIAIAAKRHWGYPERWIEIWTPSLTITPAYIAHHETWMALLDDDAAGFYSLRPDGDGWWLDHLWVRPEAMGQGVGAALFRHARMRAGLAGASTLRIESDPNAQGFYEKMGAVQVGEHRSEVDGQPRMLPVMEMEI